MSSKTKLKASLYVKSKSIKYELQQSSKLARRYLNIAWKKTTKATYEVTNQTKLVNWTETQNQVKPTISMRLSNLKLARYDN